MIYNFILFLPIFHLSFALADSADIAISGDLQGHLDISAISCIDTLNSQQKSCLIASDETNSLQRAVLERVKLEEVDSYHMHLSVLNKPIILGEFRHENDLEGLTNDGTSFFAVGSHGLTRKKGDFQKSRFQIFKLTPKQKGETSYKLQTLNLSKILKNSPVLSPYYKKKLIDNGVNIEGLAYHDKRLYVGFRSPIINGKAQFISFLSNKFWSRESDIELRHHEIDLGFNKGIRSFEFRNQKLYIISGASEIESSDVSQLIIANLLFKILDIKQVPHSQYKLEGFELINESEKLYVYDSQLNGLPTVVKNLQ